METARPEKKKKPVLLPRIIFGTGSLGNLYAEPPYEDKRAVIEAAVKSAEGGGGVAVFDSAGKYGAGLALEVIGQAGALFSDAVRFTLEKDLSMTLCVTF